MVGGRTRLDAYGMKFPLALASAFLAIPLAGITVLALRWMAWTEALLAASLLGPRRLRSAVR
jgi:hypothetical protein